MRFYNDFLHTKTKHRDAIVDLGAFIANDMKFFNLNRLSRKQSYGLPYKCRQNATISFRIN